MDLIWSQHWDRPQAEIFFGLKDGSLDELVLSGAYAAAADSLPPLSIRELAARMIDHMLQALDVLACEGIVHRDVKPDNIFYVRRAGAYHFQLGDFGLSNFTRLATTQQSGTPIYMAPEVYSGSSQQTPKADVWSLFVTLLWTLDHGDFRARCDLFRSYPEVCAAVQSFVEDKPLVRFRAMAAVRPDDRASAAQMLCANFGGRGLITPRDLVLSLAAPVPPAPQLPVPPRPPRHPAAAPIPKPVPRPIMKPANVATRTAAVSSATTRADPFPNRPPRRPLGARQWQGPTRVATVRAGNNTRVTKRQYDMRDRNSVKPPRVGVSSPSSDKKTHIDADIRLPGAFPAF